ncbi:MAG: M48 family metallopeptidase [Hyphomicrobiales bacterium]|nr:M48 family metallopeptidase [Hyphomicrobiales bacterium]
MRPRRVPISANIGWKALRRRRVQLTRGAIAATTVAALVFTSQAAAGVPIVRDAETEALIQAYAAPIFKVAGLDGQSMQIFLVPDRGFNAFVADPSRMFINTGTILTSETPDEVIGVLAHEAAHLAQGDLAGIRQTIANSTTAALIGALVGVGAALAGSATGLEGIGQAGTGIMAGSMHAAQRNVLAYARAQEASADRTAVAFLDATGQSGAGMVAVLRRLADEVMFSSRGVDPYVQSHPLPADRVATVEALVRNSPHVNKTSSPELQRRHDLVRAKLAGFTMTPQQVGRRYPQSDASLPARYARAIAAYRAGALNPAIARIDELIQIQPDNPFFWELKGQALLEGGRPADALVPLRQAVSLAPRSGLLRILYGQALVATEQQDNIKVAIKNLTVGLQTDPDVPVGWRTLARAHALAGDVPRAELATAEGLFVLGNFREAQIHATRAQERLKTGSPGWVRAGDIIAYTPPRSR